jgi:hypothetical protein
VVDTGGILIAVNDTISDRRQAVVDAMLEVRAASEHLQALFDRLGLVTAEAIGQIELGTAVLEIARTMELADRREILNEAGVRLRKSRHELQRSMFLLAVAEGESRAEIARIWRVSRQLVSRIVGETVDSH